MRLLQSIPMVIEGVQSPADDGGEGGGIVHVAVSRSREKSALLIKWTAAKFVEREICLVHVHKPSKKIPTLLGNMPASRANEDVVAAHREMELGEMKELLKYYESVCHQMKVKMRTMVIESDQVHEGIVNLVNENRIGNLIMGAVPVTWLNVKSKSKYSYVTKNAPLSCEIWFINKDRHFFTRGAAELIHSVLQVVHPMTTNMDTRIFETLPYNITVKEIYSRSDSLCYSTKQKEECLYSKLTRVNREVERLRDKTLDELLKAKRSGAEVQEAIKKINANEFACALEIDRKREAENMLRHIKREQDKVLQKKEEGLRELKDLKASMVHLESNVRKAKCQYSEVSSELKCIQVSITATRLATKKLQRQKMDASSIIERCTEHGEAELISCHNCSGHRDSHQLHVFSLSDVENATCSFSESFKLGQGGYGCVYKGELMEKTVAIKVLYPQNIHVRSEFQKEVQVLGKLKHPNLVNLLGLCPEAWSLVYDYLPYRSLEDHLFRRSNVFPLTWKVRVRIISEIASALLFLHSAKPKIIIHGDLKPRNILLDSDLSCKICDFGIPRLVSQDALRCPSFGRYTGPKGAFPYSDPEFDRTGILTPKSDIYSFGVIILQLVTGRVPADVVDEIRKAVSYGNMASVLQSTGEEWPTYVARRLTDLGLKFCELNSRDRPVLTLTLVKELERLPFVEERPSPCFFHCPITKEVMHDPQIAADGFSYDGDALREWLSNGHDTSPMTNLRLSHVELTPNHALRHAIQDWVCK